MPDWSKIEQKISVSTDKTFKIKEHSGIGGGDTNDAYRIDGLLDGNEAASFFIKFNEKSRLDMFEAEAAGLHEIEKSQSIRVPHVVGSGTDGIQSFLILESLLFASGNADSAKQLGHQLALMHKHTSKGFGWCRDNTIGPTKQINTVQLKTGELNTNSWINFWGEHRLGFQLKLAHQNSANQSLIKKGDKVLKNLEVLFAGYAPSASLLHGDLWSGNYGYLKEGIPVLFDPAIYYGDREADLAMTELFGGFPADFYSSYNAAWPLDNGYPQRKTLYKLYHVLNHFNLFGGGYAMQAENMLGQLIDEFGM